VPGENDAPLVLKSENIYKMVRCSTEEPNHCNTLSYEIMPMLGLLVLINANVRHDTWAIFHTEERISISFTTVV
jgi:hypothetical protein